MTKDTLDEAIEAAKQFLKAAKIAREKHESDYWYRSKESATVRRRSMDLTNALAKMRKP